MAEPSGPPAEPAGDVVRVEVPADGSFLGLLRTVTAAVGARLDLTVDEIEDLRLAVNEAAAMLVPVQPTGAVLEVTFAAAPKRLTIRLEAPTGSVPPPDTAGFGWVVLSALAGAVRADTHDGRTTIELTHSRRAALT